MKVSAGGAVVVAGWVALVVATMVVCTADGRLVNVGGKDGWNKGINYTVWASQETIYVGDWLLFRFDKNYYDVLEVNQTNFKDCLMDHFIANVTRGGRDVYELKEARPYYFICSKGYCFDGMKLAINVSNPPPPAPAPTANNAAASSLLLCTGCSKSFLPLLVLAISILAFLIKV